MGMKRILIIENNYEDDMKLEPQMFKRTEQDLRETLLRSSTLTMTMRNHHEEFVRYSGIMKREKPEPKKKII
jgi:hypothetical protein